MSTPYLKKYYEEQIVPELRKSRGYKNIHEVPRVTKVVLNSGFSATLDKKQIEEIVKDLSSIAGQRAVSTKAKKSVSNFKLREGVPIGVKVTLRGARMYEFLIRLIAVALPGIRDFRGVPDKFDGKGNYTLGISDHTIFPETHGDGTRHAVGLDVVIVTSAETDDEGRELLRLMGMPFRKRVVRAEAAKEAAPAEAEAETANA
jgi:large subunit ribosomal protein L5